MREISVCACIAKRKLQDRHAGNVMPITQRHYIGSNVAKVFREKGQSTKLLADLIEEFISRAVDPAAMNCGWLVGRDLPKLRKATEMIEPDKVAGLGGRSQALYPPLISGRANCLPVVKRIAPSLAGCAEIIGRHAGNNLGLQV